ncbi:maleylpyruvate isomerase family mycothiol-dependent enzyme [Demetria terragena]|uniref:maleylpyruvate isomerase family mycothiol-dependent enzyme n=1 Tax=Demetria terragena TaxID=63959 RepID=UPI00037D3EB9|nr:maleylpyruvate isomerase family mycothiol-dependent enzyme [Demetria terragena]
MDTATSEYACHADAFDATVRSVIEWDAASPCEGWDARDVLQHIVETQRDFLIAQEVDLGAAPELCDPTVAWSEHDARVREALADPNIAGREFDGAFGPTTVGETMARFYGFDLVVHRWDVAQSAGQDERFSDAELDLLERSVEGFGEHLYGAGICKPAREVGPTADRQERILAKLGRAAVEHQTPPN